MMKTLWILFTFLTAGSALAADIEVKFATGEWPPYSGEKLEGGGSVTELISAICRAAGIQPVYLYFPWQRAELVVERGEVFAAFPYAVTEERAKKYTYSAIISHSQDRIFYYAKNPAISAAIQSGTPLDLRNYTVGVMAGNYSVPELQQAGIRVEPTTELWQSIQKLKLGRVDFVIDNQAVFLYEVKKALPDDLDDFRMLPKPYGRKNANALITSTRYPDATSILEKFNAGLAAIKKSGEYGKIIRKHKLEE